jgi:hypothetical protein
MRRQRVLMTRQHRTVSECPASDEVIKEVKIKYFVCAKYESWSLVLSF